MKGLLLISALLLFHLLCFSQFREEKVDSIAYYQKQIQQMFEASRKAVINDTNFRTMQINLNRLAKKTDKYGAFVIYTSVSSADFSKFNADNAISGFPAFKGNMVGFGIGMSRKKNRRIFEINFGMVSLTKKVENDSSMIKTGYNHITQFEFGYDLVKDRRLNLYPYAGFGLREINISFNSPYRRNNNPRNITEVVQNNQSVGGSQFGLSVQAGIGLDVVLTNINHTGGTILFAKAGTNQLLIGDRKFKLDGFEYDPQLRYSSLVIAVGFKFFGR
ncbi:hypothetical protein ESA94_15920 [Lacibacter luteus]|uniref:Outer membrane protein beta-barrel domain-containing protein n=1 Tax=Lacibacter luteus TaxID=2508719 RepID=A0A4Q1CFT2_9BACT|nr:hypothetical protein [Lacibacter luteus]RXK58874.1 hypothetical protein ESA94_15920 [Lacibacter luteus]